MSEEEILIARMRVSLQNALATAELAQEQNALGQQLVSGTNSANGFARLRILSAELRKKLAKLRRPLHLVRVI
jgi:hypothetical protein